MTEARTPGGGWDCHAHLFGPYAAYPLAANRSYTPPEAERAAYLALLARLELEHGVLVHPSAYGEDHSLLFDTLSACPQLRGVIVTSTASGPGLRGLRDRGVRAARFSHRGGAGANFAGSASFEDLQQLAPGLADEGLHAELWTDCASLPAIASQLRALPVPVVIDHMGGFKPDAGLDDAGWRCLVELLSSGKIWVKLCLYRNVPGMTDLDAGRAFHDALVRANPERLIWGSDWPHLRVSPQPDAARLLQTMKDWVRDPDIVERILKHNPEALYR